MTYGMGCGACISDYRLVFKCSFHHDVNGFYGKFA